MISFPLLAHVTQRVFGATLVVFVQHNKIGEIEHVNFLKLTRRAVFAGHDIDGEVHHVDDLAVALPDAGRFNDDEVEAKRLQEQDVITQHFTRREMLPPRRNRAHIDAL